MIDLTHGEFSAAPYPHGVVVNVFSPGDYARCLASWPPESKFRRMTGSYEKWSLSEVNHPEAYMAVIRAEPIWRSFYSWIKRPEFANSLLVQLQARGFDFPAGQTRSRFEFSSLPAAGGRIDPHRDIPSKLVTLVLPMVAGQAWDPAWGGGTDLLRFRSLVPEDSVQDYKVPRSAFEVAVSIPYVPNQALIFVRSPVSWHSVGPFTGPQDGPWRRTLTVNIERR